MKMTLKKAKALFKLAHKGLTPKQVADTHEAEHWLEKHNVEAKRTKTGFEFSEETQVQSFLSYLEEAKKVEDIEDDGHEEAHEAEAHQAAINSETSTPSYPVHVKGTEDQFHNVTTPELHVAQVHPIVGRELDASGKPSLGHRTRMARLQQVLDSYSFDADKVAPGKTPRNSTHKIVKDPTSGTFAIHDAKGRVRTHKGKKLEGLTEKEAHAHYYGAGVLSLGQLDGKQLTSIPHIGMPHDIKPTSGAKATRTENNGAWDEHIKKGFTHAWDMYNNNKGEFGKLVGEANKLFGGTTVWSKSSKLAKTDESDKTINNWGIYMPPADTGHVENRNACANCTRGCKNSCLSQSGYGGFESTQVARIRRSHVLHAAPAHFAAKMIHEMTKHQEDAKKEDAIVAWRPNATTDHKFHEWIPDLFGKSKSKKNENGVDTIQHPDFKGSFSYFYTAVPDILKNASNPTFSFKENNQFEGLRHLQADKHNTSWLPLAIEAPKKAAPGYRHPELPHGITFTVHRADGSKEHYATATVDGDKRDDRPNDHWKGGHESSPDSSHFNEIRTALKDHPKIKLLAGHVAVGTTKLPIDPKIAEKVKRVGAQTGFLHDPKSKPPEDLQAELDDAGIGHYNWHHVDIKEPKISLMGESRKTRSFKQAFTENLYG